MTPLKDEILKQFDERFNPEMTNVSGGKYRHETFCCGGDYCGGHEEDMEKFKSFLSSAIDQMLDAAEGCVPREITKEEKDVHGKIPVREHEILGYETCRTETLSKLKALRGEINNVTD